MATLISFLVGLFTFSVLFLALTNHNNISQINRNDAKNRDTFCSGIPLLYFVSTTTLRAYEGRVGCSEAGVVPPGGGVPRFPVGVRPTPVPTVTKLVVKPRVTVKEQTTVTAPGHNTNTNTTVVVTRTVTVTRTVVRPGPTVTVTKTCAPSSSGTKGCVA